MTVELHGEPTAGLRSPSVNLDPRLLATLDLVLKAILVFSLARVLLDPSWANLDGKAPLARVVLFPVWALVVPAFWFVTRRASPFPWLPDVLVTLTCVTDIAGNRWGLYDSVSWFDDLMHVLNAALVSTAFVVLTVDRSARVLEIREAAVAFGVTASLAWELFEFATFLTRSTEWTSAYEDTVGDLVLGWVGSVLSALLVAHVWRDHRADRVTSLGQRSHPVGTISPSRRDVRL